MKPSPRLDSSYWSTPKAHPLHHLLEDEFGEHVWGVLGNELFWKAFWLPHRYQINGELVFVNLLLTSLRLALGPGNIWVWESRAVPKLVELSQWWETDGELRSQWLQSGHGLSSGGGCAGLEMGGCAGGWAAGGQFSHMFALHVPQAAVRALAGVQI